MMAGEGRGTPNLSKALFNRSLHLTKSEDLLVGFEVDVDVEDTVDAMPFVLGQITDLPLVDTLVLASISVLDSVVIGAGVSSSLFSEAGDTNMESW